MQFGVASSGFCDKHAEAQLQWAIAGSSEARVRSLVSDQQSLQGSNATPALFRYELLMGEGESAVSHSACLHARRQSSAGKHSRPIWWV
ncbi:hypothetical protein G6F68_020107 [Rhizopus microsporus]|nr:hypothetical protein G6F68_020107 [Rhizopus microsporus]